MEYTTENKTKAKKTKKLTQRPRVSVIVYEAYIVC